MKRLTQVLTAIAILATSATTAGADEYRSIRSQALRIQNKSRQLLNESRRYRNTASYNCLVNDLENLAGLGRHIRDLARNEASIFHLEADLAEMDGLFRHVAAHYEQINREVALGVGHIRGCTARTWTLLRQLEEAIQCTRRDVAAIRAGIVAFRQPVIRTPAPVRYQTNYYDSFSRPRPPQAGCPNTNAGGFGGFGTGFGGNGFGNPGFGDPRFGDLRFGDPRFVDPRFGGQRGFDRDGITFGNDNFRIRLNF